MADSNARSGVASGWTRHIDRKTGKPFYHNAAIQESHWKIPSVGSQIYEDSDVERDEPRPDPWVRFEREDSRLLQSFTVYRENAYAPLRDAYHKSEQQVATLKKKVARLKAEKKQLMAVLRQKEGGGAASAPAPAPAPAEEVVPPPAAPAPRPPLKRKGFVAFDISPGLKKKKKKKKSDGAPTLADAWNREAARAE